MKNGYSLPFQLGSSILKKVCNTQSLYFNWTMFNYLDKVTDMEEAHGPSRNPKLLENDPQYTKLGPIGEQYSKRVKV